MATRAARESAIASAVRTLTLHVPLSSNRSDRLWTRADMVARQKAQRETADKTAEVAKKMDYDRQYTTAELMQMGAR